MQRQGGIDEQVRSMSGHSKWSTIKRKKGALDAQRGKIFSKLAREITIAVKIGGTSVEGNGRLRLAIQNARSENMPKENIARAIKKATGAEAENYQEVVYEGYAPHGIAVCVEALTDNLNRTTAQVRHLLSKHGGSMDKPGALDFLFQRTGCFLLALPSNADEDELTLSLIDAGASHVEKLSQENHLAVECPFQDFGRMHRQIEALSLDILQADIQRLAQTPIALSEKEKAQVLSLVEALEDDDDVQRVFHNLAP